MRLLSGERTLGQAESASLTCLHPVHAVIDKGGTIQHPVTIAMKTCFLVTGVSLLLSGAIALSANPAQAFSFTTQYTATLSGSKAAKGDIFLNAVTLDNGKVIDKFTLIDRAHILSNDLYTGGNSGAASADIGDLATTGVRQEAATSESLRAVLNNKNLNNIIDTEESGTFILDLGFANPVDNIFIWERGMNSRLDIQALDGSGNTIGNRVALANSRTWDYAGFDIDTQEIGSAQRVGSIGVNLSDLGISTGYVHALRVYSNGKAYNGPDFKLMGSVADVPEPSALIGLGAIALGILATTRRSSAAQA